MNDSISKYLKSIGKFEHDQAEVEEAIDRVQRLTGSPPTGAFLSDGLGNFLLFQGKFLFRFETLATQKFDVYSVEKNIHSLRVAMETTGPSEMVKLTVQFKEVETTLTLQGKDVNGDHLKQIARTIFLPNLF